VDESSITQNRSSRRSPVLLGATVEIDGSQVPVKLRNLSETGALIEGDRLPPEGDEICFRRGNLQLKSCVVWVEGKFAGLRFATPLKREDLLRYIPQATAKARVQSQADFRRPGLTCRPLSAYERGMLQTWLATSQLDIIGD
jgi:hypothetical protein